MNPPISHLDGANQKIRLFRKFRIKFAFPGYCDEGILFETAGDDFNGHAAGDLSLGGATHSIGEHKQVLLARDVITIFIGWTDAAIVGAGCHLQMHCFCICLKL